MSVSRLEYLFDCFLRHQCNADELGELMDLVELPANEEEVKRILTQYMHTEGEAPELAHDKREEILSQIFRKGRIGLHRRSGDLTRRWVRASAAAAIVVLVGSAVFFVRTKWENENATAVVAKTQPIISPGGDKAMLTLADGSVINLEEIPDGAIQQQDIRLVKNAGLLQYYGGDKGEVLPAKNSFNVLSTPRGGQYQLQLGDGSRVWLNAASTLKYPVVFAKEIREVELTGEAFFEVKQTQAEGTSAKVPFNVIVMLPSGKKARVNVLGTSFNVNAYDNEQAMKTTLLEGSVRIADDGQNVLLRPGQQAKWLHNGEVHIDRNADIEEAVAWKNGLFYFDNVDINSIMRQIGRWYNVEIEYKQAVSPRRFVGKIRRSAEISEVLEILRLSDIDFTVEGKTIVVH